VRTAVRESVPAVAEEGQQEGVAETDADCLLVANTRLGGFRMVLAYTSLKRQRGGTQVLLSARELQMLQVRPGDPVRTLTLNRRKTNHG
jgi:arginine/ornithine N-succinyltransferase beta subunit